MARFLDVSPSVGLVIWRRSHNRRPGQGQQVPGRIVICEQALRNRQSMALRHGGVQLISAYSWTRSAVLVGGKGRGGMFLFLLFLHFHSCPSLSSLLLSLLSLFSLSLGDETKWSTRVDVSLSPNTIKQSTARSSFNDTADNGVCLPDQIYDDFQARCSATGPTRTNMESAFICKQNATVLAASWCGFG